MPYAADNNTLSKAYLVDGIEITEQQYREGVSLQARGGRVEIRNGEVLFLSPEKRTVYSITDKAPLTISENEETPSGYTDLVPGQFDIWSGDSWIRDEDAYLEYSRNKALKDLSNYHNSYTTNHTMHRGINITINVEARINASEVLASVKSGEQPLPLRWYSGSEYITVETVQEMQDIRDAIFIGLQNSFNAKNVVIDMINESPDPASIDVEQAWRDALV